MSIVAGVDSSTQSCSVVLYETDSQQLLGAASVPHPPVHAPACEQDPHAWWSALCSAMRWACDDARLKATDIDAISVDAQHHGLVALDRAGRVIRPAKLWSDTTSAPQAQRLVATMPPAQWVHRTGSVPTAAYTITKLQWLKENEPENFCVLRRVLLPHDWLTLQLCGRAVTDRADASGTGYFDPVANVWDCNILAIVDEHLPWDTYLPEVLGGAVPAGLATTRQAREIGLRRNVVVAAGTGDQGAAALGIGLLPGDTMVGLGTSGVVTAVSARPVRHPDGAFNGCASASGTFQPTAVTLNAARVTDTVGRWLQADHDEMAELALRQIGQLGNHPTLVPYFDGERTPNRPHSRGFLVDLTTDTSREQIALAAFEGVTMNILAGWHLMEDVGLDTGGRLVITGGGARSAAYRRVTACLSGRPVHATRLDGGLASARGAAIQAAAALTGVAIADVVAEWMPETPVVAEPQAGDTDYAHAAWSTYRAAAPVAMFDGAGNA